MTDDQASGIQDSAWTRAFESGQLSERPAVFKHGGRQIAVFRVADRVFAVDNRCPHEGYPLAVGTVDDQCLLTCNWHNWKFRLEDGECVLGGDDVRAYPAKQDDGYVWVDLSPPPLDITRLRILKGLKTAFERREFDRICREVTRLKLSGIDPLIAVREAVRWSFDRLEFGTTHAYAAAADWLAEARRYDDDWESRLICIGEAVDHMAFDALRHPRYEFADAASAFDDGQLTDAIESEDRLRAESLVRRALDDGLRWPGLEPALVQAALAHYNDFGHSLIYVHKTRQLLEALPEVEGELALALVRSICYATREDLIPEFDEYAPALDRLLSATRDQATPRGVSDSLPFPLSTRSALDFVAQYLPGRDPLVVYDRLLEALARNLLHFDTSYGSAWNRPVSQNVGWLDFTHGITFANAVRVCCGRHPEYWPHGLLQMACFVGRNQSFLDLGIDENEWTVDDDATLLATARQRMLDHGLRDPIFSAHLVKTTLAVEEELPHASPDCRRYLLAGLNRFLNSPIKQKHVRRLARQAIDLVRRDYGPAEA